MKASLVSTLIDAMNLNEKIVFLTADLGFMSLEPLFEKFPERVFNVGISEANMINMAGGLARSGKIVFCYSMIPFIVHRCLEQVKLQLCCSDSCQIALLGVGAGFTYGPQGSSHHAIEDVGIVRSLPNIDIYAPGTAEGVKASIDNFLKKGSSCYIRLGWSTNNIQGPEIQSLNEKKERNLVISYGSSVGCVYKAMSRSKIAANFLVLNQIKPLSDDEIVDKISGYSKVLFVEPNVKNGGVVQYLEALAYRKKLEVKLHAVNFDFEYAKVAGSKSFYEDVNNQSPEKLESIMRDFFV